METEPQAFLKCAGSGHLKILFSQFYFKEEF